MAANAYILLNVDPAKTGEVMRKLRGVKGAVSHEVTGPYDIVVEISRDTAVDITATMRSKIRSIPGVTSTVTCLWIEGFMGQEAGGE